MGDYDALAQNYTVIHWQNIRDATERALQGLPVRIEPAGDLHFELDFDELSNVDCTTKVNGSVPTWDAAAKLWKPGTGGTAGTVSSKHNVHFGYPLPITVTMPGPTNITGGTLTITATRFASDGEIAGTMSPGGAFSFSAGGGTTRTNGLNISWPDNTTMTLSIGSQGTDGSYLVFDAAAG